MGRINLLPSRRTQTLHAIIARAQQQRTSEIDPIMSANIRCFNPRTAPPSERADAIFQSIFDCRRNGQPQVDA